MSPGRGRLPGVSWIATGPGSRAGAFLVNLVLLVVIGLAAYAVARFFGVL